ncbi:sodium:proton antiporter [Gordonia amarae]|uniref:Sodium:proton antiporter n=2 Tax=Gordonia amarae TaxID=36821 RepID=A0A857KHV7_9ACTN|nr:sodium:proton antiporter [Gordonia amarae]MCS3878014.1 CPA1 family monovalent cation:H+ antiporter [Gordonia amarae]QHN16715.1 sodium:proton antiporter [Gordonia amarae]QHN21240.1 sodium:proton antiporter [Gordonia amarae]QHN30094.1 sodium:proton antiporter [Gordonia amarae]QHN38867.1 sodium:proton antiporter [Gordonia amarae]
MEKILVVVVGILVVALAQEIGPRIRISPPLILVVTGAIVGILPMVPEIELDPEWILVGVLPPLLYSAAVSMPAMDFRRELGTISALSFLLVLVSAVALGFFFTWLIPELDIATGIALGAIVSPTDAVATSIAKRVGAPSRVIAVLEGESMLNDASALVLLRAAVAATASSISFAGVAANFVYAVLAAVVVGGVVGVVNLRVGSLVRNATVNTAISFTVPFLAYLPAEELGASGLVAAVTAGLVTGTGAVKYLTPQHRFSDRQNWRTIELILEGGVFLVMGLELYGLVRDAQRDHTGVLAAIGIGVAALLVITAIRAMYVVPLVWLLKRKARRRSGQREILADASEAVHARRLEFGNAERSRKTAPGVRRRLRRRRLDGLGEADLSNVSADTAALYDSRLTRRLADIDYVLAAPMGKAEATIIIWAGMRGVVTLAAAQTLPADTQARPMLVLIAFVVAALSLLIQGGSLPLLIKRLTLRDMSQNRAAGRARLRREMGVAASRVIAESPAVRESPALRARVVQWTQRADEQKQADDEDDDTRMSPAQVGAEYTRIRRAIIAAQREILLRHRESGVYSSGLLTRELAQLDAEEISLDMRAAE